MDILSELGKRIIFFDGAMGTQLQQNGLAAGELPEAWNLEHPQTVKRIHAEYRKAGCDILKANTFGANPVKLEGCPYSSEQVIQKAVELAREAVRESGGTGWTAMDIGPTGKLLQPMGDLAFEDAVSAFSAAAKAGEQAGADLILIETMSDLYETKAAVLAAKETTRLPVFVTLVFDESGRLLTGGDIASAVALLEGLGVDAVGLNCGMGPDQMRRLFPALFEYTSLPVIVNPNAGLPETCGGKTVYRVDPEPFSEAMLEFARDGAWMLGGCCGTTPAHLAETVRKCRGIVPKPLQKKRRTWVSSYSRTAEIGEKPIIIGERINPTGKPRMKAALREKDLDYLLREAVTQQQNGAHVLDVNVGLPEINEPEMMRRVIPELQSVTDLPLQIDTTNPEALEAALRIYNGRPLINSVSGKEESMRAVFPLAKKYGGTIIALTLDENGIPDAPADRLKIAEKIVRRAGEYGIPKESILVDTLTMAVSAAPNAALATLETLKLVRERLGCGTCLGVSNVSFGLPSRETINAAFFSAALWCGLSAAIINPNSKTMMDTYYASVALRGLEPDFQRYLDRFSGQQPAEKTAPAAEMDLKESVIRGLRDSACAAACERLRTAEPLEIIHQELIPALDVVGKEFEAGRLYLPRLLMSAEAAKAVFELLRVRMAGNGTTALANKGKVVLATVKDDVHDIGKNIVKVLMENYGYQVIDMGKDVPAAEIVETAKAEQVRLVGLSALMTTTVVRMEETIRLLRETLPECRVMVGGAVLNEEYAEMIHADYYAKDAMSAVRYAEKILL